MCSSDLTKQILFDADIVVVNLTQNPDNIRDAAEANKNYYMRAANGASGSKGVVGQIKDKDGTEIDRWISTNEPHYVEKMPAGDYTLTEITAPSGYKVAESIDFTVLPTGEIQTVVMKDAREDTPTPTPDNTPTPNHTPQPTPNTTPAPTPVPAAPTATPTPLLTDRKSVV